MSKRRVPLWANVTWFAIVIGTVAYYVVEGIRMHLGFVQVLGLIWFSAINVFEIAICSGAALLGIVWLIDFFRGRATPPDAKSDNSDVANFVP